MIAKFVALVCLFGAVRAGNLYGAAYGSAYGGAYSDAYGGAYGAGYAIAPSYTAYSAPIVKTITPVITKAIATPIVYSTPAVSSVSQYSIHSAPIAPIVKSYAPISYAYSSPLVGHSYAPALSYGYGNHGYGNLGYSGYGNLGYSGYGKHAW